MYSGKTIFSQLTEFLSHYEFHKCVQRYKGDHKVKTFSCWDQFLCMAFAQLTYREGLTTLSALLITKLYKCRWQVELFFKWIKQHLRIKKFYGTSENAVKTQIWIAVSVYVLVAIVKKRLKLDHSLYTILQILSIHIFEKTHILQALSNIYYKERNNALSKELHLFD